MPLVFAEYDWEKEHPGVRRSENHPERRTVARPDGKLLLYVDVGRDWYCLAGAKPSTLESFIADAKVMLDAYSSKTATCVWGSTKEQGRVGFKQFNQSLYRRVLPDSFYLNVLSPLFMQKMSGCKTSPFRATFLHPKNA